MEQSIDDKVKGKFHQVKGKAKRAGWTSDERNESDLSAQEFWLLVLGITAPIYAKQQQNKDQQPQTQNKQQQHAQQQ